MNQTTDDSASLHALELSEEMKASYDSWRERYIEFLRDQADIDSVATPQVLPSCSIAGRTGLHGFFRGFLGASMIFPRTRAFSGFQACDDTEALLLDWLAVGSDIYGAMHNRSRLGFDNAGRVAKTCVEPRNGPTTVRR